MEDLKEFKVFISFPIHGKSDDDVFRTMLDGFISVKKMFDGVAKPRLIDQTSVSKEEKRKTRLYFLGRSIQMLDDADLVVFVDRWDKANGCRVEYETCCRYGIPMLIDGELGFYDISSDIHMTMSAEEFVKQLPSLRDIRREKGTYHG